MARKRNKDRVGDVLGLGSTPSAPVSSSESIVNHGSDEAARRRHRMSEGADELTPSATTPHRGAGATGIDMGAGGEGTDLD